MLAARSYGCLILVLAWLVSPATAAIIDDPLVGGSSSFSWEEPGSLTRIDDIGPPTFFALLIDDSVVPWSSFNITSEVISYDDQGNPIEHIHYFDSALVGQYLDAGTHTFTLVPDAFNSDGTTGMIAFSAVAPAPLPQTVLLFAVGMLLLMLTRLLRLSS
jgi:ABC-type transport system substrate-binding protein